jgi:hypothetical protein
MSAGSLLYQSSTEEGHSHRHREDLWIHDEDIVFEGVPRNDDYEYYNLKQ